MQNFLYGTQFAVRSERAAHRHALPPILIGMLAPMVLFLLIDPLALTNASLIVHVYMFAIYFIASAAYLISIFETGEVTSATVDRPSKTIIVERTGLLAKSVVAIAFADVAAVRVESNYDDDGYQTTRPVLVLTTRDIVPLPVNATEADIATMRAMLKA